MRQPLIKTVEMSFPRKRESHFASQTARKNGIPAFAGMTGITDTGARYGRKPADRDAPDVSYPACKRRCILRNDSQTPAATTGTIRPITTSGLPTRPSALAALVE